MQTLFFLWNKHSGVVKTKDVPSKQSRPLVPHSYCLFSSHSKQPPSSGVHTWTLPNVWCTLEKTGGASPPPGSFECNWQVGNVGLERIDDVFRGRKVQNFDHFEESNYWHTTSVFQFVAQWPTLDGGWSACQSLQVSRYSFIYVNNKCIKVFISFCK